MFDWIFEILGLVIYEKYLDSDAGTTRRIMTVIMFLLVIAATVYLVWRFVK